MIFSIRRGVIRVAVLIGASIWLIDGALDYLFFYEGSFLGLTFTNIPPHELYIRLLWFVGMLIIGLFASRIIDEREEALDDKEELESSLRAIRNVNQRLVREDDKNNLIEGACSDLMEARSYEHVWIVLFDEANDIQTAAQRGLGEGFERLLERIESGQIPPCIKDPLNNSGVIIVEDPSSTYNESPLAEGYQDHGSMTVKLEYEEEVYGLLSASVSRHLLDNREERELFKEVAGDIGFALHDIDAEEKRKRAEEQFRRAIQLAPFPMMIHAEDGKVIAINDTWLDISGYERRNISTVSDWTEKAYGEARNNVVEHIERLYELEDRLDEGEYEIRTEDGGKRIWDFSSAPIGRAMDGRRLVLSMADDVTVRKRAESRVEEERDRAQRYLDVAGSIIVLLDQDRKVKEINRKGCELLGYERKEVIGKDWFENFIPEHLRQELIEGARRPLMEGDVTEGKRYENPVLTKDGEERIIAWENSPIKEDSQIVGTLSSGIDVTERRRMEEQIEKDKENLQQSFIELAETTSRVLGVRDPYTQKHELRVGELARVVGERMGLGEDKLLGLYIGGVLHDIGKIVVPETILTKPGDLKDVEWEMIKSHPEVGYKQILEDTDFPWPVAEMTLHHHERLDGSGYPDGLEGDELTTEVRVLGAVDVVEAMSTRRPYREARSKERTMNVIKDGKGSKFDPEVVEVLVEMINEGNIEFGDA